MHDGDGVRPLPTRLSTPCCNWWCQAATDAEVRRCTWPAQPPPLEPRTGCRQTGTRRLVALRGSPRGGATGALATAGPVCPVSPAPWPPASGPQGQSSQAPVWISRIACPSAGAGGPGCLDGCRLIRRQQDMPSPTLRLRPTRAVRWRRDVADQPGRRAMAGLGAGAWRPAEQPPLPVRPIEDA